MSGARACRGFSLLELLVAFTLLATLFGALLQIFSDGLHAARAGERTTHAVVIAQSRLATLGVEQPLRIGVASGAMGNGYHWRVTVRPYLDDQLPAPRGMLKPLAVTVEVFWEDLGQPQTLTLTSMLLGRGAP